MSNELKQLSLSYRYRPARRNPSNGKSLLLILLHGLGSNEDDLFGLSPYLDNCFAILSVRAPIDHPYSGYAWYAVEFTPTGVEIDEAGVEESRKRLIGFVHEAAAAYDMLPSQIFLLGFSQGAAMSASVLLTRPDLIGGAVLMSGHVLPNLPLAERDELKDKPVMVVHGMYDELLPIQHGRASRDLLQSLGLALTYREYPMGHQVTEESLEDVDAWLGDRLT